MFQINKKFDKFKSLCSVFGGSRVRKFEFLTQVHGSVMLKFIGEDGVCIVFGLILTLFWMS